MLIQPPRERGVILLGGQQRLTGVCPVPQPNRGRVATVESDRHHRVLRECERQKVLRGQLFVIVGGAVIPRGATITGTGF